MRTKPRLTPEQKKALDAYNFALKQEDRYLGSVFANPVGARDHEAKVQAAYERCKRLGMTHEHGLAHGSAKHPMLGAPLRRIPKAYQWLVVDPAGNAWAGYEYQSDAKDAFKDMVMIAPAGTKVMARRTYERMKKQASGMAKGRSSKGTSSKSKRASSVFYQVMGSRGEIGRTKSLAAAKAFAKRVSLREGRGVTVVKVGVSGSNRSAETLVARFGRPMTARSKGRSSGRTDAARRWAAVAGKGKYSRTAIAAYHGKVVTALGKLGYTKTQATKIAKSYSMEIRASGWRKESPTTVAKHLNKTLQMKAKGLWK